MSMITTISLFTDNYVNSITQAFRTHLPSSRKFRTIGSKEISSIAKLINSSLFTISCSVDGEQIHTTSPIKKTLNPYWNETFEL
jgi:hypothetical protein